MKQFHNINGLSGLLVSVDKVRSKSVLRRFLEVAVEVAEWTDSERLFQREGAQE